MQGLMIAILLVLVMKPPVLAEELYKCVQADGSMSFQQMPCKPSQQGEQIVVKPTQAASGPSTVYAVPVAPEKSDLEKELEQIEQRHQQRQRKNKQIWDDYYRERCERYTQYHEQAVKEWEVMRRKGYKQWERTRMENEIKTTRGDMKQKCAEKY